MKTVPKKCTKCFTSKLDSGVHIETTLIVKEGSQAMQKETKSFWKILQNLPIGVKIYRLCKDE